MQNNNKKNRIVYVFICDSVVDQWHVRMLERLFRSGCYDQLFWVSVNCSPPRQQRFVSLLFKIDAKLARCHLSALNKVTVDSLRFESEEAKKHQQKPANLNQSGFHTRLPLKELSLHYKQLASSDSVLINCTGSDLPPAFLRHLPASVYSIYFGENRRTLPHLIGLLEFLRGKLVVESGIQLEKAADGSSGQHRKEIVFSARSSIESVSVCRTVQQILLKSAVFLPRYLEKRQAQNNVEISAFEHQSDTVRESVKRLTLYQQVRLSLRYFKRVVQRIFDKLTIREQWILLIGINSAPDKPTSSFRNYRRVIPPSNQFWADPFIVSAPANNGTSQHYLFLEIFPYQRNFGHLACMEIQEDGTLSDPVTVLERPYHLSYPNVFSYQDRFYMIPESGDNETVELYEAAPFPYQWRFRHNLLQGIRAYDATLLEHDGTWWMFAAVAVDDSCPTTEELYLFFADSPLSQNWQSHPANPVVSDASRARPAGQIFHDGKQLIRPSQDCAGSYGAGINWCVIEELNKHSYRERVIKTFRPDWDKRLTGIHTFNFNAAFTVSDAIWQRRKYA